MRYYIALFLCLILLPSAQSSENTMNIHRLKLVATCTEATECTFNGSDLPVRIEIINIEDHEALFPLLFHRKAGPIVELRNLRTGASKNLRRSLVEPEILKDVVVIQPGKSIYFDFKIPESHLRDIGGTELEIMAIVKISMDMTGAMGVNAVTFEGTVSIPIKMLNRR